MTTPAPEWREALQDGELADLHDPAEVVGSEVVFTGRVWNVRRDAFLFDGHEITRDYVDHTGAVAVLAMDDEGRVVLINQYRHPIGMREWEIPAGLLDVEGEDPLEGAQRELAEEVDLVASEWEELIRFHTSPGGSDEAIIVYRARGLSAAPEAFARTEEEADLLVRWVPLEEIVQAAVAGRIHNSILLVAALAAHARG